MIPVIMEMTPAKAFIISPASTNDIAAVIIDIRALVWALPAVCVCSIFSFSWEVMVVVVVQLQQLLIAPEQLGKS